MGIIDIIRRIKAGTYQLPGQQGNPQAPFAPTPVAGLYNGAPGIPAVKPVPTSAGPMEANPAYMVNPPAAPKPTQAVTGPMPAYPAGLVNQPMASTPAGRGGVMNSIMSAFNTGAGGQMNMPKLNSMWGR